MPAERPSTIRIGLLGPLEVRRADGSQVDPTAWSTAKNRQLLRLLALNGTDPVSTDRIIAVLWPDATPTKARASLRTAASHLRKVLGGPAIARIGTGLRLDGVTVDTTDFTATWQAVKRAQLARDDHTVLDLATTALHSYRGEIELEDPVCETIESARERFRVLHAEMRLAAATAALNLADPDRALEFALPLAFEDPSSERACRVVMRAYAALDERSMALRVHARCRRALSEELGLDPSPPTEQLFLELLTGTTPPVLSEAG